MYQSPINWFTDYRSNPSSLQDSTDYLYTDTDYLKFFIQIPLPIPIIGKNSNRHRYRLSASVSAWTDYRLSSFSCIHKHFISLLTLYNSKHLSKIKLCLQSGELSQKRQRLTHSQILPLLNIAFSIPTEFPRRGGSYLTHH